MIVIILLKRFSIKNHILPELLSEEFTKKYPNATKFRDSELEKRVINVISNVKMLHSIAISNKLGIVPVDAFLENYKILYHPMEENFKLIEENRYIGEIFGYIFQFIFEFKKFDKPKSVDKLGIKEASWFNPKDIIIEIIE